MEFDFFLPKSILLKQYENGNKKRYHNMSQGPPNPGFMQEKVQKGDFLKKDSRDLKFCCCFRFLWISWRPGMLNWKRLVFLLSKIPYKKCEGSHASSKEYEVDSIQNLNFRLRIPTRVQLHWSAVKRMSIFSCLLPKLSMSKMSWILLQTISV